MFKKTGIKIRTKKAAKKRVTSDTNLDRKSCGILTSTTEEQKSVIDDFVKSLTKKGYKVSILTFSTNKLKESIDGHFDIKSFDWKGKILSPSLKDFTKTPFDFLFSINTSSNLSIENVLALSNAKIRVGANIDDNNKNLDFVVNMKSQSSLKDLTANILEYTERIIS